MIKTVKVTNHYGEELVLDLTHPDSTDLAVASITGITPIESDISLNDISSGDGAIYSSARVGTRNIVLTLIYLGNSIENTRLKVYKYFPVKKKVRIDIETDNRKVFTEGYVEHNEVNIFSSLESSQISIICPDPYLYSLDSGRISFSESIPVFEFPFSNENDDIHSVGQPGIAFSVVRTNHEENIVYEGSIDTGIEITVHAVGPATNIRLYNSFTREEMRIDTTKIESLTGSGIIAKDNIIISTYRNNKSVYLLRNGIKINILNCINKDADWFQLVNGNNIMGYTADTGINNLIVNYDYKIGYEGV